LEATTAAIALWRERFLNPEEPGDRQAPIGWGWADWQPRVMRYAFFWAAVANDQYRDAVHTWSAGFKEDFQLYRHVRGVFNNASRIVELHVAHIYGGPVDPAAGDGRDVSTAIPILGATSAERSAFTRLWADSRWGVRKDVWTRTGAALGDAPLTLHDDATGWVGLLPLDPATVEYVLRDAAGETRAFARSEARPDPQDAAKVAWFREECRLEDDETTVTWRTYIARDQESWEPYGWAGSAAVRTLKLGFCPLWMAQHIDIGKGWGKSELAAGLVPGLELDQLASQTDDHAGRLLDAPFLVAGMDAPRGEDLGDPDATGDGFGVGGSEEGRPGSSRDRLRFLYTGRGFPDAKATPVVLPAQVAEVYNAAIPRIDDHRKSMYPELVFDDLRMRGGISGEAIRLARQPAVTRFQQRRANYDDALQRAMAGALALGGLLAREADPGVRAEYAPYRSFGPDYYWTDRVWRIDPGRPVFAVEEIDRLAEEEARGRTLVMLKDALPLGLAMKRAGYSEEEIAEAVAEQERLREEMLEAATAEAETAETPPSAAKSPLNPGRQPAQTTVPESLTKESGL
jgi:hypothetical protein